MKKTKYSDGDVIATSPHIHPSTRRMVVVEIVRDEPHIRLGKHLFAWDHFFEVNNLL